jgi:hypothetical protein
LAFDVKALATAEVESSSSDNDDDLSDGGPDFKSDNGDFSEADC